MKEKAVFVTKLFKTHSGRVRIDRMITLLIFYLNYSDLEYNFRYKIYLQNSDIKKDVYEEEIKISKDRKRSIDRVNTKENSHFKI